MLVYVSRCVYVKHKMFEIVVFGCHVIKWTDDRGKIEYRQFVVVNLKNFQVMETV